MGPDLLREMVQAFAEVVVSAEADAVCGVERTNSLDGYRRRGWYIRAGTIDLAIGGTCLRARISGLAACSASAAAGPNKALVSVLATSYLLGVSSGRVEILGLDVSSDEEGPAGWGSCVPWPLAACLKCARDL